MRLLFIGLLILKSHFLFSQKAHQEWLAINGVVETKNYVIRADVGYRLRNFDFSHPTQFLGRCSFSKKWNSFQFGIGGALFFHATQNSNFRKEYRPFLQVNYLKSFLKHEFSVRFRNEFRFFERENLVNRMRLNLNYKLNIKQNFALTITPEFFYSLNETSLFESRYQFGSLIRFFEGNEVLFFYQYNWQKGTTVNAFHVLGITYTKRLKLNYEQ
jgi:hypothetical protein